ncbi:hypothetical protein LRS58_20705 [Rhodococcus sp. BH2-1]|nr:hypothetical protein [Rhodococcus sp. BH2-1]
MARALRHRFGKGECAVVAQDNVRRTILRESDQPGAFNITLIELIARECLARGRVTIVEGILDTSRYAGMLERLAAAAIDGAFFYAFDLSFEQTVDRHITRSEAAEFTPEDMRGWYRGHQPLPFAAETVFDASWPAAAIVDHIYADLCRG